MQKWKAGLAATLFAGIVASAMVGASQPRQEAHPQNRPVKKADATPPEPEQRADPRAEITRENNFGVALMNRQQFEKALGKFQRACILDPETDLGCVNMGIAFLNMQRFDEARAILEKAGGNATAAIDDFQKVAGLDSYDADTQYFLGLIYSQQQQYDKAMVAFRKAISLNPFQVSAEFGLAQALQRSGDTAGAKQHFDKFQHMTSEKLGKPISFIYGEQGKYSLAAIMQPAPEPVPPAMPVHFVNVTPASGLPMRGESAQTVAAAETPAASPAGGNTPRTNVRPRHAPVKKNRADSLARFLGSGACIIDYDGDGKPDIFLVDSDGKGNSALFRNLGGGHFVNVTREAKLDFRGQGMGCAVGDYDNDGKPDLAVSMDGRVLLFHNEGNRTFKDVTQESGIFTTGLALGLTFIDYDHDGDLDLYVTRFNDFPFANPPEAFSFPMDAAPAGNVLWRNNGNGTFTDWTSETALGGDAPSVGAIGSDINNDRAIDFVVTGWRKSPVAYLNPREGAFKATTPWSSDMPAPTAGVVALDFNKDGWMDLAFTHWGSPGLSLWRNVDGKSFDRVPLPDLDWMRGWGAAPIDYDNDGWIDLVAVGENFAGEGRIVLLRNEGAAGFRDVTASTGLDKIVLHNPRAVIAFH